MNLTRIKRNNESIDTRLRQLEIGNWPLGWQPNYLIACRLTIDHLAVDHLTAYHLTSLWVAPDLAGFIHPCA